VYSESSGGIKPIRQFQENQQMLKDNQLLFQLIDEREQSEAKTKEMDRMKYYKSQLKKLSKLSSTKLVGSAVAKKLNSKMRVLF
jgi:type I site-specific restriction-modification system R (restriction) subunit